MRLGITILTKEGLTTGFELAGIESVGVDTVADMRRELQERMARKRNDLVLVDDLLFLELTRDERREFEESDMPLFVPLPIQSNLAVQDADESARTRVADLVQHAIGKRLAI